MNGRTDDLSVVFDLPPCSGRPDTDWLCDVFAFLCAALIRRIPPNMGLNLALKGAYCCLSLALSPNHHDYEFLYPTHVLVAVTSILQ